MENLRIYGEPPFTVAVLHGGPGAPGYMAPVARELSLKWGVLEPLQTASTVEGQVQELKAILQKNADLPVCLIGSSWGAWLGFILSARFPELVRKLILIGSGAFEEKYAIGIMDNRLARLSEEERGEAYFLMDALIDPEIFNKDELMARFGKLCTKADAFDPLTLETEEIKVQYDIYNSVWTEAWGLRKNGTLMDLGEKIECPVVAVHGDSDPHPAEGVRKPLSKVLKNFRFILLEKCGHYPWLEKYAQDEFFKILKAEL
jgi:pimeloyl-ACP methyl ester carboxylesterase